jgi:hypothetical protein
MAAASERATLPTHGSASLPNVEVDSYNLEIENDEGFVGDQANRDAFWKALDDWRKTARAAGSDPFGDTATEDLGKSKLDELLASGPVDAAGIVQSAIEDYAKRFALVVRRFLRQKTWKDTQCIVVGGGFRAGRIGELSVGRAGALLKAADLDVEIALISHDPDEAGLVGGAHLLPPWMLKGSDGILAVDVGGTNIRAGVVELRLDKAKDLSAARVWQSHVWRHADEEVSRTETVEHLGELLRALLKEARKGKLDLAPIVAVGCPGVIEPDGSIVKGAQNLPGNWESSRFNFPAAIQEIIPSIGEHETLVVLHNDAVVQGLSQLPSMQDYEKWGVLTIGTGLGNARFTNRRGK